MIIIFLHNYLLVEVRDKVLSTAGQIKSQFFSLESLGLASLLK